jgi:hypothetical protein
MVQGNENLRTRFYWQLFSDGRRRRRRRRRRHTKIFANGSSASEVGLK